MTAKEYLQQLRMLDIKIRHRKEQVEELRALAMYSGSFASDGERVQTSGSGDRMSEQVARYVDLQAEVEEMIRGYTERKDRIIREIHELSDARYVEVLFKRYVEFKSFERIACEMNYNYTWICELHGKALQAFERTEINRNKPKNKCAIMIKS